MRAASSADREAALQTALRLLAVRARTRHELTQRLRRRGFAPRTVADVVRDLVTRGLVDDRAFARERARTLVVGRRVGARRLRDELRAKGVAAEIVEAAVKDAFREAPEEGVARAAATNRLKVLRGQPPPVIRRRLTAYLLRRGFSPDIAHHTIASLLKNPGELTESS